MQLSASFEYSKVANKNVMTLKWRDYREINLEDFSHKNYVQSFETKYIFETQYGMRFYVGQKSLCTFVTFCVRKCLQIFP